MFSSNAPKILIYMENKLTWAELKKQVAQQTKLTEKEVNLILTGWLDEMTATLKRGEDIHISGLGTFRMKTMKPRKSVNVTTGEAILLPETQRLTYTMPSNMEEMLNDADKPRIEVGIDPIQKLSNQADEIVDILGELGQGPKSELASTVEPVVAVQEVPSKPSQLKKEKQHLWITALATILVFFCVVIGLIFFFQCRIEQWLNNMREEAEMVGEIPNDLSDYDAHPIVLDTILQEELDTILTATKEEPIENSLSHLREYTEFIGTENMHQDSRLAWMAYRYYGKKDLWVFIYDANRDHLTNPENIPVGTPIRIPKLTDEMLTLSSPELQSLVQQMSDEFLKK